MSSKKADISQIKKYLEGELSACEQHELERAALDDPFLQDAMDGFAQSPANQQANLDALDALLDKRINPAKVRRLGLWPYLAAAAVLVALTLSYLLWPKGNESAIQVAATPKTEIPPATKPDTAIQQALTVDKSAMAINKRPVIKQQQTELKQAAPAYNETTTAPKVNTDKVTPAPPNELKEAAIATPDKAYAKYQSAPVHYGAASRLKFPDSSTKYKEITVDAYGSKKITPASTSQTLLGKVEGAKVITPEHHIQGTIYDESGHPLPGVSVFVKETNKAVMTDVNGKFTIAANGSQTLNIGYIGYLSKQITANPNDSVKVSLESNSASLSEVVITNAMPIKPDKRAHPRAGWDNYNRYLERQAKAEDDIPEGIVKLSFTVGANGELSNFRVVKSLNKAADAEAIDMVKNGSAWQPAADGKPKTITLKIRFKK